LRCEGPLGLKKGNMCKSAKALFVFAVLLMLSSCLRQSVGRTSIEGSAESDSRSYTPSQEGLSNTEIETATFALG
jgi:hypothetical protein